jgi:small-conductance mechanosensitive channel
MARLLGVLSETKVPCRRTMTMKRHRARSSAIRLARVRTWAAIPLVQVGEELGQSKFTSYWTYELLKVDGNPITVRKVVVGVVLLILGHLASRLLSRMIRRGLSARFKVSAGAVAALESLSFYVFLAVFSLSALAIAGVPLTAFTLLGGAAAIGIGFGSQTVIKNFISGLILMVERPIRVGNLVQIGDLYGTVERIGTRSTLVRTGENVDIIVPNSSFLEQNVVNWTLTAPEVRIQVAVGVVYGSPTERVEELLLRAVAEDDDVLTDPAPFTLFTSFGESSLDFEVHFWIRIESMMDRRRAESRVRRRIEALFRESELVIAFPQRDVHLDSAIPLDVRLVEPSSSA